MNYSQFPSKRRGAAHKSDVTSTVKDDAMLMQYAIKTTGGVEVRLHLIVTPLGKKSGLMEIH